LEVILISETTYTSLEALQRFADLQGTSASQVPDPVNPMSKAQEGQAEEASTLPHTLTIRSIPSCLQKRKLQMAETM
jgi:hypothetical protein